MLILAVYYVLLVLGLSSMLIDGLGWLAWGVYFVAMPAGAVLIGRMSGLRWKDLGLRAYPGTWRQSVAGGLIAFGLVTVLLMVMRAAGWVTLDAADWSLVSLLVGLLAQQAVVATIEEWTFRGVLQSLIAVRRGNRIGLAVASLLFAFFHLPNIVYQDVAPAHIPITLANLAVMGAVFGIAYQRTGGRLWLPIALHFGWNIASFGVDWFYQMTFTGPDLFTGLTNWFPESGLGGTLTLTLLGLIVYRLTQGYTKQQN